MSQVTVQTTQTKQPGKREYKEEISVETKDGSKVESTYEVKQEVKTAPGAVDQETRLGQAEAVVHRNVIWALGAGVLPIPVVDVVAVTSVQLKMLKELSDVYDVPFTSAIAKKIIGALLAGVGSVGFGSVIGASLSKLLPIFGTTVGVISVPIFAAAFTHATGRVFLMHFESGGTVLDFNPQAMRKHFKDEFEKAKESVARIHVEDGKVVDQKKP